MKWDLLCRYEIVPPFKQGLTWAVFKIHVVVVCGSNMEKLNIVVCYTQFFDKQFFSPCYRRFMDNKWKIQRKMKAKAIVCFLHVWGFILPIVLLKKNTHLSAMLITFILEWANQIYFMRDLPFWAVWRFCVKPLTVLSQAIGAAHFENAREKLEIIWITYRYKIVQRTLYFVFLCISVNISPPNCH